MTKKLALLFLFIVSIGFSQSLPLIPQPQTVQVNDGNFILNNQTVIIADPNLFEAKYLQQEIKNLTGLDLKVGVNLKGPTKIGLYDVISGGFNGDEESAAKYYSNTNQGKYFMNIYSNEVSLSQSDPVGNFYAIQTLLQLIPAEIKAEVKLPCVQITDAPKYAWRGMHLDCARHFFPVSFVKKYIDYLALYKFNTFHWHLTDDQGWRIEIKKYPKLALIGGYRNGSMVGHYNDQKYDDVRYGGFYSQQEIKDVVAYAAQRHITIVPEIEMPGHAVAALAAYPQYSCTGGPFEVAKQWGVLDDVFCPKEETFVFLQNILTEVMALFPSQYIHIGGDECPKTRWQACPHCQALMKEKGLKDEHELQSYFIQRIEKFVNSKGRKIIGWDEILEGGLAPNAAVMSWRGTEGGIAAARQKHKVVMSPGAYCYFDQYQSQSKNEEPLAIGGFLPVEKVYAFDPTPKELSDNQAKYILGAQANVWTEYIDTPEKVEYMIFPRMMALSEVLWGTSKPDEYDDFKERLIQQLKTLDAKKINYCKAVLKK